MANVNPPVDRAKLRRDEILQAAEEVFATKGYHAAGIADIATALGIGHGTFYRYFKNKHDIALRVFDGVIERLAAAGLSEDPEEANTLEEYRTQTQRILSRMLELAEEHPHGIRFFHQQSVSVDPNLRAVVMDTYAAFTGRFLKNGVDKGFLRVDLDVPSTSEALVALIFEGTRRALDGRSAEDRRRWVDAGVALMFDGIRRA